MCRPSSRACLKLYEAVPRSPDPLLRPGQLIPVLRRRAMHFLRGRDGLRLSALGGWGAGGGGCRATQTYSDSARRIKVEEPHEHATRYPIENRDRKLTNYRQAQDGPRLAAHFDEAVAGRVVQGHLAVAGVHHLGYMAAARARKKTAAATWRLWSGAWLLELPRPRARNGSQLQPDGYSFMLFNLGTQLVQRSRCGFRGMGGWALDLDARSAGPKGRVAAQWLRRAVHLVVVPVHAHVALVDVVPRSSSLFGCFG